MKQQEVRINEQIIPSLSAGSFYPQQQWPERPKGILKAIEVHVHANNQLNHWLGVCCSNEKR